MNRSILLTILILISSSTFSRKYNVLDFGAVADGKTVNTDAINKAVDACSQTGGIVVFPAGDYVTGTIFLKSNVTLQLQKGATILGSTSMTDYPPNVPDYKFYRQGKILRALIYAENCENIGIEGEGMINGRGGSIIKDDGKSVKTYGERPHVIWMVRSKHIRIEDISLRNSALWMEHYLACEDLYIHNIDVYNHCNKNNDMIDINGCKNVVISDCRGDSDDDGITMKSTHKMPCENILIDNCVISSHCNAIKCGTESNAGFKNIVISNCIIRPSKDTVPTYGTAIGTSGISLEVVDGAEMNGISINNVVIQGTVVPLFIRLGNRARGFDKDLPKPGSGSIQNITISNITAYGTYNYTSSITGIPGHDIRNVTLDNIRIFSKGGGTIKQFKREVPELETDYPEAVMFDELPASGLYVRHVQNITINNVEFHFETKDMRPALYFDDVKGVKILNLSSGMEKELPMIFGRNIKNVFIQNPLPDKKCKSAIEVTGSTSKKIRLTEVDKQYFKKLFETSDGAEKNVVKTGIVY